MQLTDYRSALGTALSSESKAYGFALVVWGGGSLLTAERGLPGRFGAVGYVAGLLLGVALSIGVAQSGPASDWAAQARRRLGAGAVHLLSVAVALAGAWGVALAVASHWLSYFLAGTVGGLVYQLVLGLEVAVTASQQGDD
jgi:hypothetical protein